MKLISIIDANEIREIIREEIAAALKKNKSVDPFADFPEMLNRFQVADLLGITIATVDNWANQGRLQKHRIGSSVRFRKSEVIEAIQHSRNRLPTKQK